MKPLALLLILFALLLPACLSAVPQTSAVSPTGTMSETAEVLPTSTPIPPTETPTPTATPAPIRFTIEQMQTMTAEDKLKAAPQVETVPADVIASFLPKGTDAAGITWGEKTLTYWDRVVSYHGTVDGQEVTIYYDFESGQWAKKYESFESLSQIPADQIPDVMVLGLGGDLGDRLIRNKLQYDYDWISQPPAVTEDGKQIFRDEKGYPKAVWDTKKQKWLTPEEADVVWTWEKWEKLTEIPYIGYDGNSHTQKENLLKKAEIITDPKIIMSMRDGNAFLIFNLSGIITVGGDRNFAVERLKEGATIMTLSDRDTMSPLTFIYSAARIARVAYENGYRDVSIEVGEVPEKLRVNAGSFLDIKNIVTITLPDGTIVSPIFLKMPEHFTLLRMDGSDSPFGTSPEEAGLGELNLVNWLDKIIKAGFKRINLYSQ